MLQKLFLIVALFLSATIFAQIGTARLPKGKPQQTSETLSGKQKVAAINQYRIISLQKDTTYVDTTLSIKSLYHYNYLRKDTFGLLPFSNEGQTYMVLNASVNKYSSFPQMGYKARHISYLDYNDIEYYSVATPISELYYKTVMSRGQSLEALFAINTTERLNISFAYKGLRSTGKYINQLTSNGNFRFTTNYNSKNERYFLKLHYTGQDTYNQENGGITNTNDFESGNPDFKNRVQMEVYFSDATSFLKGKRLFVDHNYRLNKKKGSNNLLLTHQFNYENKFFEYEQNTITSSVGGNTIYRFGDSYLPSNVKDQAHYNRTYNKLGLEYGNELLGKFTVFTEDFKYNYYFDKVLILDTGIIPSSIKDQIKTLGGQYAYRKNNWNGLFSFSNSLTNQNVYDMSAALKYQINTENSFNFQYQSLSKIPDNIYNLHQSSFVSYNWSNDFKNEKINNFVATANTPWLNFSVQLSSLNNHLYFSNNDTLEKQLVTPKQYDKSINYFSAKASREFKFGKFALDNTLLFQQVGQDDPILNVPKLVTRNTLYYSDYFFSRALFIQTGMVFNYFTNYYANDYNPIIGDYFVQNTKQVGNFPMFDFFINGRIRQTRIFLQLEHFNSAFSGNNYYTAPNYPYRDFTLRFGLVWNFFQ